MKKRNETCPICKAVVIVWPKKHIAASLLRALALADHVRVLHGIK